MLTETCEDLLEPATYFDWDLLEPATYFDWDLLGPDTWTLSEPDTYSREHVSVPRFSFTKWGVS
jgi:hypothetical protein